MNFGEEAKVGHPEPILPSLAGPSQDVANRFDFLRFEPVARMLVQMRALSANFSANSGSTAVSHIRQRRNDNSCRLKMSIETRRIDGEESKYPPNPSNKRQCLGEVSCSHCSRLLAGDPGAFLQHPCSGLRACGTPPTEDTDPRRARAFRRHPRGRLLDEPAGLPRPATQSQGKRWACLPHNRFLALQVTPDWLMNVPNQIIAPSCPELVELVAETPVA